MMELAGWISSQFSKVVNRSDQTQGHVTCIASADTTGCLYRDSSFLFTRVHNTIISVIPEMPSIYRFVIYTPGLHRVGILRMF